MCPKCSKMKPQIVIKSCRNPSFAKTLICWWICTKYGTSKPEKPSKTLQEYSKSRVPRCMKKRHPTAQQAPQIHHFWSKICSQISPKITLNFRRWFFDVLGHILAQIGVAFCPGFGPGRTHLAPKGPPSGPKRHPEAPRDCHGGHQGAPRGLQGVPQCHFGLISVGGSLVDPRTCPKSWPTIHDLQTTYHLLQSTYYNPQSPYHQL